MKKLLSWIFNGTVLTLVGLLALAMLIWFIGPQVAVAEWRPLDGTAARAALIGALAAALLLRALWRRWQARRCNAAVVRQLTTPPPRAAAAEPGEPELLQQRFEAALRTLRQAKFATTRGWWDALSARLGRRYLYELPWYTIIGSPGAGKTTALLNSGLRFPLAAALGQQDVRRGLTGVAGTRNIEWWFTDEAVLIDTAGRYTTQDSDSGADREAWSAFLALLKKSRPRLPVNGVLVTVSVPDLLAAPAAERLQQARALRSRVQELHEQLGVRFPLYLLVTKCDLLAGFMDYLGNADRETRAAPWGFTFALDPRQRSDSSTLPAEFDALVQRLVDGLIGRLQSERDLDRRARIYGFPQQFGALRESLREFVDSVFSPSQFEAHPLLRGVYFISGTQEGTPLDRVLGAMARSHGLERAVLPPNRASGKAFFLERLLREVVFAESELGGTDLKWERRRGVLAAAGYAGIAAVSTLLLAAWAASWARNRAYVDEVAARVAEVQRQGPAVAAAGVDPLALLPGLRATRELATAQTLQARPGALGFGLNQDRKLDAAAEQAYRQLLTQALLPRLVDGIAEQLRQGGDDPQAQYEALKAYLMLHDPQHFDAAALNDWLTAHWKPRLPEAATTAQREELDAHLAALLAHAPVVSPRPPDQALIERVRAQQASASLPQRIYGRLLAQDLGKGLEPFTIARAGGAGAALVFRRLSDKPLTQGVPGLYSPAGYHEHFRPQLDAVTRRLGDEQGWVLGTQDPARRARRLDGAELARLGDEVRKLYLADYAAAWQSFIADIAVRRADNLDQAIQMARVLSGSPSPLKLLVAALVEQTTLDREASPSLVDKAVGKTEKVAGRLGGMLGPKKAPTGLAQGASLESIVDDKFVALRALLGAGDGKPAPIDRSIAIVDEVLAHLTTAQAALQARMPAPPAKLPEVEIQKLPEPVRTLVVALAGDGIRLINQGQGSQVADALRAEVGEFCRKAIAGRYPVRRDSPQDIRPADFATLFAPGALMDKFFQKNLADRVDTSKRPWTVRLVDGKPAAIDSRVLVQFQRAAAIRDTFFPAGSALPTLRVQFAPAAMDSTIHSFILDVDGQIVRYAHGPAIPVTVQWPGPQNSAQVRLQLAPPAAGGGPSAVLVQGPWALLRLFDGITVVQGDDASRFRASFEVGGRKAEFEVTASSVLNPFRLRELNEFSCPGDA